jgi:lipoprotein NlpI
LSLGESKEEVNDHFCHYLYELERSSFSAAFESASQICNLDPRMAYIKKEKRIKLKGSEVIKKLIE